MTTTAGYRDATVALRDLKFHYQDWGDRDAPPVVLLHGLTGHSHNWDHVAPDLARDRRLLALDQRGHGETSWPQRPDYATETFVADTLAFVDALGLREFVLVGLSMGGHNAMAFAAEHPERVMRLVPIDIPPAFRMGGHGGNGNELQRLAEEGHPTWADIDEAYEFARRTNTTTPEENLRYRLKWALRETADGRLTPRYDHRAPANWRPADLWDRLPAITQPTLLVRGGDTLVLPADVAQRMEKTFPRARLVTVPGSGHPVPTDKPEELVAALRAFLST